MEQNSLLKLKASSKTSWTMMFLALSCIAFLALYIPPDRRENIKMFRDSKVQLPTLTQWVIAIPDIAFPLSAIIAGVSLISIQWLGRGSVGCASIYMFVIVASAVLFVVYRESIYRPLFDVIWSVSGVPHAN